MRGLRHLIPDHVKDQINQSPYAVYIAAALMALVGALFLRNGMKGIREKSIVSKGRRYTGSAAVVVGLLHGVIGVMLIGAVPFVLVLQ